MNTLNNLDLNNFELFLLKSGFITNNIWTSNHSEIFDWSN